jgi:hypothetical protein
MGNIRQIIILKIHGRAAPPLPQQLHGCIRLARLDAWWYYPPASNDKATLTLATDGGTTLIFLNLFPTLLRGYT